jgi:hypothetical protein
MEIWQDIQGYDGKYQISNFGNVKSTRIYKNGSRKELYLKFTDNKGYKYVHLCKNGEYKQIAVHRLVAKHFISNPNNLPQINHKDYNRSNNKADNLEWCTHEYNILYSKDNITNANKQLHTRNIYQYDNKGNLVKTWNLLMDIFRELKLNQRQISDCCNGKVKTCGGYVWSYIPLTIDVILNKQLRHQKPVQQYTKEGNFIAEYNSGKIAQLETGIDARHISSVCKGKRKFAGGYFWKFK